MNESLKWRTIYRLADTYCVGTQSPYKVDICQLVRRLMFACLVGVPFVILLRALITGLLSFPPINLGSFLVLGEGLFSPYVPAAGSGEFNAIGGFLFIGSIVYFAIVFVATAIGIGEFFKWAKGKIVVGFRKIPTVPPEEKEPSLIAEWYRGIKEKTCFYIQFDHN